MTMQYYVVHIEEIDTYANTRRKYYMKRVDDVRVVATFSLDVAQHICANMGNDFRYRRHAVAVEFQPDEEIGIEFEIALKRECDSRQEFYL